MNQETLLFEKALAKVNSILNLTGLQLIDENNDASFLARLRKRPFFLFIFVWFLMDFQAEVAWFIHGAMTGKGLIELTFPAPSITTCLLAVIKSYCYLKYEPCINDLIRTLRMLQSIQVRKVRHEVDNETIKRMMFLTRATDAQYWLNLVSLGGFAILPFLIMALTYSETGKVQYFYPFVIIYPFDVYNIRIWPIMYLHQMYSAFIVVFMVFGPDALYYACCNYIYIQFRYLQYDFERIISGTPRQRALNNNFPTDFADCLKRHKQLIRCTGLMEHVYSKSTLFNVLSSSMLICLTGFNATAMESWALMMPFISFVFLVSGQIFLFCYFGDLVMRASSGVSDAVYNSKWYYADITERKHLLFVLTRAQKPCKLTAYGFSDIKLATFARILSTAWSYFALLSTMNENY